MWLTPRHATLELDIICFVAVTQVDSLGVDDGVHARQDLIHLVSLDLRLLGVIEEIEMDAVEQEGDCNATH